MKKVSYSPDVDAMLIELSDQPIAYAEDEGNLILHYAEDGELILIEILEVQSFKENNVSSVELAKPNN